MRRLIERADREKHKKAMALLDESGVTENSGKASEVRHGWQAELGREALVARDGVRLDGRLLLIALVFLLSFVSVPFLLLRHTVSSGLQDYYLTVYRSTCASWERRTAALPACCSPTAYAGSPQWRRGRAAAGAEREPPAHAFEGCDAGGAKGCSS